MFEKKAVVFILLDVNDGSLRELYESNPKSYPL